MIKQLVATLVALAVVAVLVMTVLHRDRYTSMLRPGNTSEQTLPELPVAVPASAADTPTAETREGDATSASAAPSSPAADPDEASQSASGQPAAAPDSIR